ncbi:MULTISPECIES: helix-turn-helix transcriptional regulator [unclassified Sphingobacterium]|nr:MULTISPECIES: helix-turn-helix transcriptional regulator [unclassified Sphingobacterium]
MAETINIGSKIGRIRELRGIKQEVLAAELGISQSAVSHNRAE